MTGFRECRRWNLIIFPWGIIRDAQFSIHRSTLMIVELERVESISYLWSSLCRRQRATESQHVFSQIPLSLAVAGAKNQMASCFTHRNCCMWKLNLSNNLSSFKKERKKKKDEMTALRFLAACACFKRAGEKGKGQVAVLTSFPLPRSVCMRAPVSS